MRIKKFLQGIIPDDILHYIPNQVTCIGDIAILNVPHFCENYYPYIIEAILSNKQYIRTIVNKTAKVQEKDGLHHFNFSMDLILLPVTKKQDTPTSSILHRFFLIPDSVLNIYELRIKFEMENRY
jgi:hypothetical protein